MPGVPDVAIDIVTRFDLGTASVGFQKRAFGIRGAQANEARIQITFQTADVPVSVYHGLRKAPTGYVVVSANRAARIYNDLPFPVDSRTMVLKCDTANTVAEVIVR